MNEQELERMLRRYRPVGPPPDLRHRILSGSGAAARVWPWFAAAAVLAIVSLTLQFVATQTRRDMRIATEAAQSGPAPLDSLDQLGLDADNVNTIRMVGELVLLRQEGER